MRSLKKPIALLITLSAFSLNANAYTQGNYSNTSTQAAGPLIPATNKANAIEQYYVNVKHRFNGANYEVPPNKIKKIKLSVNVIDNGALTLTTSSADQLALDNYLKANPLNSELLASYVARMVNFNQGYTIAKVKDKYPAYGYTTVAEAMLDELNYQFAGTAIQPVKAYETTQDLEATYLYVLSRLDAQEKSAFWQYINLHKTGNSIAIPDGTTIADVLTTQKLQLTFDAQ